MRGLCYNSNTMDADERQDEIAHRRLLIHELTRRLHVLELQAARHGADALPQIVLEIEDLRAQLAAERRALGEAPADATPSPPFSAAERHGVAVDLAHQQHKWDRFAAFVRQSGQGFQAIDQSVLAQRNLIERSAVFVVAPPYHALFTRDEIAYLADWVLGGGGLLLFGAYAADSHHMSNPSALARRFGLRFNDDLVLPAGRESELDARMQVRSLNADLAVKVAPAADTRHPILQGIREVAFLSACSIAIAADPEGRSEYLLHAPAASVVMQPRGVADEDGFMPAIERWEMIHQAPAPLAATTRYGKGRVAIAGSWKLCTLDYGDNAKLLQNMLNWLAGTD
ncbi:MAG TPA: hypothetical protein VFX76_11575 [Roseiflexaceae bacterium]|nr:hypothetical protein [Roseiflexaceae bacterium]